MGLYNNIALFLSFENAFLDGENVNLKVEIISLPEELTNSNKYIVKILNQEPIINEYSKVNSKRNNNKLKNKKFIAYIKSDVKYKSGDIVYVKGILKKAEGKRNFKGFNYRRYLKSQKIYGIIEIEDIHYSKTKKDFSYIICKIQDKIYTQINTMYDQKYQAFIGKILFGTAEEIEEKVKDDFKDSSLSHVLAISGMHITYIILFLNLVLRYLIKNIKLRNIGLGLFLVFFIALTGASASCMRACIMNIMLLVSKNIYRKNNVFVSIIFAFFFLIFQNIYTLFDIGMWLSFLGTLGILLFYKFLKLFIVFKSNKFFYQIQNIVLISISAQILIFPVILYVFNTISLTFFISNILITPIVGPIIIIGYISIFISMIFDPIGIILVKFEEYLICVLFKIAEICGDLPLSTIYVSGTHELFLVFYYFGICYLIYYFSRNRWKVLKKIFIFKETIHVCFFRILKVNDRKYTKDKNLFLNILKTHEKIVFNNNLKEHINKKYKSRIIINDLKKYKNKIFIFIFIIIIVFSMYCINQNDIEIYFIDVAQGDCTLIKTQNKNIIIDGGEGNSNKYDYGKNVVLGHLLKLGIDKIDYMIFSHFDSDHAGGLVYILENLKVEKIIFGLQLENSECLKDVIKIAKEKHIEIIILQAENRLEIDEDCYIEVFWPNDEELVYENILNNNSLVFKFIYKDFSILFTGDIEEIAEKKIAEKYKNRLECDILKVAHHGSKTSTTLEFLEKTSPKIAFIGVGKDNNFGHPNNEIIERLEEYSIKIYRTDINGEIVLYLKNNLIKIKTKIV